MAATDYHYDPAEIEPRWQQIWADEGTWEVDNGTSDEGPASYVLEMLPYPSGEPHIGHLKTMQRNWIGLQRGRRGRLPLQGTGRRLPGLHDAARWMVPATV